MKNIKLNFDNKHTVSAIKFKEKNPLIYKKILEEAITQHSNGVKNLSIRDICAKIRWQYHVHISNSITPALARVIEIEHPELNFRKTKSDSVITEVA